MKKLEITDYSTKSLSQAGFIHAGGTSVLDRKTQVNSGWYRIGANQVDIVNPDTKAAVPFSRHEAANLAVGILKDLGVDFQSLASSTSATSV